MRLWCLILQTVPFLTRKGPHALHERAAAQLIDIITGIDMLPRVSEEPLELRLHALQTPLPAKGVLLHVISGPRDSRFMRQAVRNVGGGLGDRPLRQRAREAKGSALSLKP